MEFRRNARINAPLSDVWALVDDIPTVAGCIPGVTGVEMKSGTEFTCVVNQRLGSVKSSFNIAAEMTDIVDRQKLTITCQGEDRGLRSSVRANLQFGLADEGEATAVDILADFQVTGRIATFGQRIVAAQAELVVMKALGNVDRLLSERRAASA
jgi:carbon monoxide dehydrogenase subunit G